MFAANQITSVTNVSVTFTGVTLPDRTDPNTKPPPFLLLNVNFELSLTVSGFAFCTKICSDCTILKKTSPGVTVPLSGIQVSVPVGASPTNIPAAIKKANLLLSGGARLSKLPSVVAGFKVKSGLDKICESLF
ncbi:MAG: hypothetical protein AAF065_14670 [Verrucomicrobiota bacterium]